MAASPSIRDLRLQLRDPLRLGLQSAAASAATFLLCRVLGVSELSWAVISALFVVQHNVDSTVAAAVGRLVGTVMGTAVGLASVFLIGGEDLVIWRLVISVLLLNAIAAKWPGLSYGAVAATIVALETDPYVLGGALSRGGAILLGTAAGAGAALAVWPESAARRTLRAANGALAACRDLLKAELSVLVEGENPDLDAIHDRFLVHFRTARDTAQSAHLRRHARGVSLGELVDALSRLWHGLIIVHRIVTGDRSLRIDAAPGLREDVKAVRQAACRYLEARLEGEGEPSLDEFDEAVGRADERLARERGVRAALAFSLREVQRDLHRLDGLLRRLD